jgi:anti-sigma-K factor RskA
VIGIAVGAGAVVISQNRSNDVTIEAVAPLTPVIDGPLGTDPQKQLGQAELVAAPTGQEVRVNAADLPPASNSSYEVWLFGDNGKMVSLGTLDNGNGTFTVPQGINTREYRVVDVSDEPPDGNPAHSGISLIRGAFS